ncbi:hypothetical protein YB2330_001390 [Saitoella coloradoensis]
MSRRIIKSALLICDLQEKFRAIHAYPAVLKTAQKMLKAAKILDIPVYVTTQSAAKLGGTCTELDVSHARVTLDKTAFSMALPQLVKHLDNDAVVAIVGIESHICVLQTSLDLLARGHKVYVIADGVSSMNKEEVPIALERIRQAGGYVTTSESWLYETAGDASIPEFRDIISLVRETKNDTKAGLKELTRL